MKPDHAKTLVLDRFPLRSRDGHVLVVNARAKRGDWLVSNGRRWSIAAIETYCVLNPPLPWGYLLEGDDVPAIGDVVTFEDGPEHQPGHEKDPA